MKQARTTLVQERRCGLKDWLPNKPRVLEDPQTAIPAIAKDARLMSLIDNAVRSIPTPHRLLLREARSLDEPSPNSVHLVLTAPRRTSRSLRLGMPFKPPIQHRQYN